MVCGEGLFPSQLYRGSGVKTGLVFEWNRSKAFNLVTQVQILSRPPSFKHKVKKMIKKCSCDHKGQDKLHGEGNRVHNETGDGKKLRCTVCGKEKGA